ncbi:type II toxin-antitoxin system RelE/ParE family toxin [Rheinheimera marina]|uniref:Type II toxin-antitoxin system RelE/ParE family toxin n=1 Tax=Rheinheimera marina TaxID=1774958 RepID=A0ABV9JHH8_9GAMM
MKVVWSPLALAKLAEIAEYIAQDKATAAESWVNELFDKAALLSSMPQMGRVVPELPNMHYRELIIGNYRVIYSANQQITVLTVRHCRQLLDETSI